ncbi:MAG: PepSY domain-containing protein [Pseudopedobacter saltans]|uniref:PepSY domain-containing protein n=1 Tax=Pseudopedobacter saltans TaxID=151895 RepID=A0A2W5FD68_9SPHI|nr:MAG: PepSY domain-containing protein [Pseudopedobacter saltans]
MKKRSNIFKNWSRHQKNWYGKWHLYLGIIAGFIIAIVGITGSILTFRDEIDAALNPKLFKAISETPKLSLQEAYTIFHKQHPETVVNYLYKPSDAPNATYIFYDYSSEKQIFINPFNGKVCGKRLYESGFINVVMDIHTSLFIPKVGTYIVGIASLILLILTISGLRLWIPKKWRQLKDVLTVKKGASGKRQNYDWHNVLGFYSSPVVSMLALTGFCISFYLPIVAIMFALSGKNPKIVADIYSMKSHYSKSVSALPLDSIVKIGTTYVSNSEVMGVAFPTDSSGSYRLDISAKGMSQTGRREMVVLDQYSGKILASSTAFPNVAQGVLSWMMPLHYGTFGGEPTRVLALIGGLIPAALFVTGFVIWWPRWKKQRHLQRPEKKRIDLSHIIKNSFFTNLKSGFKYAFWMVAVSVVCGIVYGLISGIVITPAAYVIVFTVPIVLVNFIIALVTNVLHIVVFLPFKKQFKILYRYFAFSSAFLVVYGVLYFLLMNTGLDIF